jgi:hypothetical protein
VEGSKKSSSKTHNGFVLSAVLFLNPFLNTGKSYNKSCNKSYKTLKCGDKAPRQRQRQSLKQTLKHRREFVDKQTKKGCKQEVKQETRKGHEDAKAVKPLSNSSKPSFAFVACLPSNYGIQRKIRAEQEAEERLFDTVLKTAYPGAVQKVEHETKKRHQAEKHHSKWSRHKATVVCDLCEKEYNGEDDVNPGNDTTCAYDCPRFVCDTCLSVERGWEKCSWCSRLCLKK